MECQPNNESIIEMADLNSADMTDNNESCFDDKKRKADDTLLENCKKIKVNSSLGLTLLQAYDEEDFPDDDVDSDSDKEDTLRNSSTASKDLVTGKIFSEPEETLTSQNLSSFIVEEEEIGPNALSEENERLESENSSSRDKVEYLKEDLTQCNDDEMNIEANQVLEAVNEKEQSSTDKTKLKVCSVGNTESEKSVVISDKKENNAIEEIVINKSQNESLADVSASKCEADNVIVSNVNLLDQCEDHVTMHKTFLKNVPMSAEYNFNIFGKDSNFDNGSANCINKLESKPTKKVKLNRSKFVKSADVFNSETKISSSELKLSPIKNSSPSSNQDSSSYSRDSAISSSKPQSDVISCTFINTEEKPCELLSMCNEEDSSEILIASNEEKSCDIPVAPETFEFYGTSKENESSDMVGGKYGKTSKCPVTAGRENIHEFSALTNKVIPQVPMTADYECITHVDVTTGESKTLDPATVQHSDQKSVFFMTENEPVIQNLNTDNNSPNLVEIPRKEEEKSSKMFTIENKETSNKESDVELPVLTPQIPMNANYKDIISVPDAIDDPKTLISARDQDNDQKSQFPMTENELVIQDQNIDNNQSNIVEILKNEEEKSLEILAVENGETSKSPVISDKENCLEFSALANEVVTPHISINTNYENIIHIPVTIGESKTQDSANGQHGDQKSTFLMTSNDLVVHDINEPNLVGNPRKEEEQPSKIFAGKYEETSKSHIASDKENGLELAALTKETELSQIPVNADYEDISHVPITTEEPKTLNSATARDNYQKSSFLMVENEPMAQVGNIDNSQSNLVEISRKKEKSSENFFIENEETSKFSVLSDKEKDEFSALDTEVVAPQIPMNADYKDVINLSVIPDEPKTLNLTTDQRNSQKSIFLMDQRKPVVQDINVEDSQLNFAEISEKEMTESSGAPSVSSSVVEETEKITSANHVKTVEQVSMAVAEETEFSKVGEFLANDFTVTKQSSNIEEMEEENDQELENLNQNYVDAITTGQRNENKRDINEELTVDIIQSDEISEGVQEKLIQRETVNPTTEEDIQTMSVFHEETPNALKTLYSKDEELDNLSNEEEIFEDAIDTTAENVSTKAQQISDYLGEVNVNPVSEMTEHQPVSLKISKELSKLEQALTGRLENFHCTKKLEMTLPKEDAFIPKPPMETIESNDNKQNIKLHLSVQGDRVSIKSSQPAADDPPTRIKRQYRKRVKNPNNLEENKARAKEYTHRLRTRTERETPGVKKQIRKKRRSMHSSTEDSIENDSKDKSKLQDEFSMKQELQHELEAKRESENLLEAKRKYELDIKQKIRDELEVKRTLKDNDELQRKFQQEPKTKRKSHDGSKVKRKQKDDLKVKRRPRNESESPVAVKINLAEPTNTSVGKVQPIKLKISKNANVTIECTPSYGPATIEKIGGTQKVEVNEKTVSIIEDARKDVSTSNYMEQVGRTWSGPDLQRVERLLKDTNITITPVMSSRDNSSQPSSVLKPILTAVKDKSGNQKVMSQSPTITAATITPISNKEVMEMDDSSSDSRNLNVTLKPFDLEDEIHHWKISKPSNEFDISSISSPFSSLNKSVDVKSEIRKKIASAEKYKSDVNEFDIQVTCEMPLKPAKKLPNLLPIESPTQEQVTSVSTSTPISVPASEELTLPKCASMSMPASVPVSLSASLSTSAFLSNLPVPSLLAPTSEFASAALSMPLPTTAVSVPTPMVMSTTASVQSPVSAILQANNLTMKEVTKLEPQLVNASGVDLLRFPSVHSSPSLPTDLFPKKRGRPTKAMVAAREAYRQHQEELDRLRMQQIRSEKDIHGEDLPPPITLQKEPKQSETPETGTPNESNKSRRGRKPKSERAEKKDSDDLSTTDDRLMDPEREAEEMKRLEEERARKDEERERKNELRRQKARERSDLVKAKRLRQKMKAQERQKVAQELRRLQMEEKKKLQEQLKRLPQSISGLDDDTRMSAENSHVTNMSFGIGIVDEDSSGATNDTSQKAKKSRLEVTDADSQDLLVNQIAEYQWPIQGGELYMIQEQVSNFLGVKSFKRKYPDIKRRPVDSEERAYLVDSGLVSETLCDLGITAVCSAEVLDIMCTDFPEKYEEFRRYMRDKQIKELSFKQKAWANGLGYKLLMADGTKQDLKKRAMESASNWNSALNKSRSDNRRCHMDLQTFIVHYPKTKGFKMSVPTPKIGSYPISILPGQFCDYYKEYTSNELRYMPVNTVLYGPLKQPSIHNGDGSQTDSDDSSSSDESSSTTSEDTQATEDTIEDMEKDMSLDETNDKMLGSNDTMFLDDKDQVQRNILNGRRESIVNESSMKALCKVCLGDQLRNKMNIPEVLITCSQCASTNHPTCLDLSLNVVPQLKTYDWQCPDCKSCARCKDNADEDKMLFCDTCDRGYHIYCVGLKKVPSGNWQCQECTLVEANVCSSGICKEESGLIEITS